MGAYLPITECSGSGIRLLVEEFADTVAEGRHLCVGGHKQVFDKSAFLGSVHQHVRLGLHGGR